MKQYMIGITVMMLAAATLTYGAERSHAAMKEGASAKLDTVAIEKAIGKRATWQGLTYC